MSISGPLRDGYGRVHTDLRISVTDRCNIRCTYCMPAEGVVPRPHAAILRFEEIQRFARVAAQLGVKKIRLTGGEPLVRWGICELVQMLAHLPGIAEVAMTTNAILLPKYARPLKAAGLKRLNISLDTLDPERFVQISRRDELSRVLAGIEAALETGFESVKLNACAVRGQSEEDIVPLARFAREKGLTLRFIEFMPLDGDRQWAEDRVLAGEEIIGRISRQVAPLEPELKNGSPAPARRYRFRDGNPARIGVIASVTQPFCEHCCRLRLTSEGQVRNCLFAGEEFDARAVLRQGGTDEQLAELICRAVSRKKWAHGTDSGRFAPSTRSMNEIGG